MPTDNATRNEEIATMQTETETEPTRTSAPAPEWVRLTALATQTPYTGDGTRATDLIGSPVHVWGAVGVAKTAMMALVAEQLNMHLEPIILSRVDPTEMGGKFYVDASGQLAHAPPPYVRRIEAAAAEGRRSLLFFDELGRAPARGQNAGLTLIHERRLDEVQLPAGTAVVAASNPSSTGADVQEQDPALVSRMGQLYAPVDGHAVRSYFRAWSQGAQGTTPTVPRLSLDAWRDQWQNVAATLDVWLGSPTGSIHLSHTHDASKATDENGIPSPFSCPRTLEQGGRLYAAGLAAGDEALGLAGMRAWIGGEAASAFATFAAFSDLPSVEALLADPSKLPRDPRRPDRPLICLSGLTRYTEQHPEVAQAACRVAVVAAQTEGLREVAATFVRRLVTVAATSGTHGTPDVVQLQDLTRATLRTAAKAAGLIAR